MTAFYIGQKVRKAHGELNLGLTGTVSAFDPDDRYGATLAVRFDSDGIGRRNHEIVRVPAGVECWGNPDEFEPILPDGLESIDSINELYEPTPEVAHA